MVSASALDNSTNERWAASRSLTAALVLMVAALLLAGCRSEPTEEAEPTVRQVAEELVRTDVADVAGLGSLSPVCPDVVDAVVGTSWQCTAMTGDQRAVDIAAVIDETGRVKLNTTNLITGAAMPSFERAAVAALNNTVGSELADDAIDCGDEPVLFPTDLSVERQMVCALVDPNNQLTYDVTLSVSDIEARQFSLVVADQPRS